MPTVQQFSPRLHLITPCCRPENLAPMMHRYLEEMDPHPFELRWHILVQGPEPDRYGCNKANECLDTLIEDGWIMFLSDDVLHDKSLFRRAAEIMTAHPQALALVFWGYERGKPYPNPPKPNICNNIGQCIFDRAFFGTQRFDLAKYGNNTDIVIVNRLYATAPEAFYLHDRSELLIEYNNLPG